MPEESSILYEIPEGGIARITLNRPDKRNAQDTHFLYALNDAFDRAAADDAVKVIILAANGPHFSAGHDLRERGLLENIQSHRTVGTWGGFASDVTEAVMSREKEIFTGFCERWRNIPKPTIAQVHGKCISGGLMLVWPCDLVVASDDALFQDNTIDLGVSGVEYFAHPWELGTRKAKELLFTADWLTAEQALACGMVNHVVPRGQLETRTMELARRIAAKPAFALKLAKEAVNGAQDAAGRQVVMANAFAMHQLAHSRNLQIHGAMIDPAGVAPAIASPAPPRTKRR